MTSNNHIYYDYCSFTEVNDKYMITCHKFCLSVFISDNYCPPTQRGVGNIVLSGIRPFAL